LENSNVLIDTSAWVEYFKGHSKTADTVTSLIETGRACICGVIYYELLQGARDDKEARYLPNALSALTYFETTVDTWVHAGRIAAGLRGRGVTLPMSDILVGTLALKNGIQVLTLDKHFNSIPGLTRYQG
jgi:predicted nucleic acid-binding protein